MVYQPKQMNSLPSMDLVTPCRNRAEDLKNSMPSWIECELINRIIVVDFNSSKPVIEELDAARHERLTVVRVENEPLWRQGRAQNVGLALTDSELVLKIDADVSIVDLRPYMEAMASDPTLFFTGFSKHGTSSGLCLAPRRKLRAIGGYHDHMSGWGGDDVDIYRRLKKRGLRREIFKAESFSEQGQKMATKNSEAPRLDSQLLVDQQRLARKPYFTGFRNSLLARIHSQNKRKNLRWTFHQSAANPTTKEARTKPNCEWRLQMGRHSTELANILALAHFNKFDSAWELMKSETFRLILEAHQLPRYQGRRQRKQLIDELPQRLTELTNLASELGLELLSP
jgi:glycosyltransferase involved in cell wall biosynthesis